MSDLDDAIREHLELKRLRGADPGEVAKLEQEALGGVTRDAGAMLASEHEPQLHAVAAPAEPLDTQDEWERPGDSIAYLPHRTNNYANVPLDAGEETQEFRIEDEFGWAAQSADRVGSRRLA